MPQREACLSLTDRSSVSMLPKTWLEVGKLFQTDSVELSLTGGDAIFDTFVN